MLPPVVFKIKTMSFVSWLRGKARTTVDGLFCSSSPDIKWVGNEHSGWVISVNPPPRVAYCAGVGLGISFELELAKIMPRPVLVFDPSPTGIATIARSDTRNLEFFPVGLAAHAGTIEFSLPKDAEEGSYSVVQDGIKTTSFECYDLPTIMSRNGDSSIDLLKMDIEGFEYDIVNRLLDERVPVRQMCVEFHDWLRPGSTLKTIIRLYRAGYRIIHKRRGDYTFLLKESRYAELQQNHQAATGLASQPTSAQ
jgi:FkbM family methyltransferase